jgi:hypothetical protein
MFFMHSPATGYKSLLRLAGTVKSAANNIVLFEYVNIAGGNSRVLNQVNGAGKRRDATANKINP